jgi:predicted RNA binding protein YcfA (HicA-like mRNA interferase family)
MKRVDLVRHVESFGCYLLRDRGKHSVYVNPANGQVTAVPRHREINDFLARKICRDLGIPEVP